MFSPVSRRTERKTGGLQASRVSQSGRVSTPNVDRDRISPFSSHIRQLRDREVKKDHMMRVQEAMFSEFEESKKLGRAGCFP